MAQPVLRSMLSVPGIRERFIDKAKEIPADVILLDLEDSVAMADKAKARELVATVVPAFAKNGRLLYVRPNDLTSGLLEEDLAAIVGPALDGILLPKTDDPETLIQVDHYLTLLEKTKRLAAGAVKIIPLIESTRAITNVEAICRASGRLVGAMLGAEDYATSLGVTRTREGAEIEYARARMANAAMAAGLIPIDCPEPDFRDEANFERDLRHARTLGYRGKFCIHPTQVQLANRAFSPAATEVEWARRVVAAYQEGERQALGAIALDGKMIDRPAYVRALELIEWQRHIEARAGAPV